MNRGVGTGLSLSRLALEERLAVLQEIERRSAAAGVTPDLGRLPLPRFGRSFRLLVGLSLGFAVASVSILFVFVLVNMVLHVGF